MSDLQRRGSTKLSVDADTFEDLSGTWQAILKAEQNRPDLRIVGNAYFAEMEHIGGIPTPLRSASGRPPRARPIDSTVPRRPALRGPCPGGDDDLDERYGIRAAGRGPQMTTRRGYTILGWLVWQVGSRVVKRKMGQTMAENRVKLGLAGAVLLVVGGGLAALAARSAGGSGDE